MATGLRSIHPKAATTNSAPATFWSRSIGPKDCRTSAKACWLLPPKGALSSFRVSHHQAQGSRRHLQPGHPEGLAADTWAKLSGQVPRIAVNNGFCFAGNAVLFGCADITIATRTSWIGMAGPAMIEGGGLGTFKPTEIGPIEVQEKNGVVDIVAQDEADATAMAKKLLSYFQGPVTEWSCRDQTKLREIVPENRRRAYPVRQVIEVLADEDSFIELRRGYGPGVITGFMRLEGKPLGLIANDCRTGFSVRCETSR